MRFIVFLIAMAAGSACFAGSPREHRADSLQDRLYTPESRSGSYLGVGLVEVTAERAKALNLGEPQGVEVTRVMDGSPAESAGLKTGDVLLSYNGEAILGGEQLVRLVAETPPGRKIKIQFWRDGKTQTAMVVTAPRPAHGFEPPTSWPDVSMPNLYLYVPDIPNPVLVWKNNMLGIEGEPLSAQLAQYFGTKGGVLVRSVDKGSAAEKAGLRAGDVIFGAAGAKTFENPRDFAYYIRSQHPGSRFEITLMRDHKDLKLSVVMPESHER